MAELKTVTALVDLLRCQPLGNAPASADDLRAVRDMWMTFFADVDDELLKAGVINLIATGRPFWPTIAQIRQECAALLRQVDGALPAEEAWALLVRRFATGEGAPLEHELDRTTAVALRMVGGWQTLANATNQEMISHRARFIDAYRTQQEKAETALLQPPAVTGFISSRQDEAKRLVADLTARLSAGGR